MQTVAPLITALISLSLAVSILIRDRRDRVYLRYAIFAAVVSVVFFCMFFYVMTRQPFWRYGVLLGALLVAPASLQVYHLALRRYKPATGPWFRSLIVAAVVQGVAVLLFAERFDLITLLNGVVVFTGLFANVVILFRVQRGAETQVEKARLRYLAVLGLAAVTLLVTEMVIQAWNLYPAVFFKAYAIQFPPLGTLAAVGYIYFLGEIIKMYRLLDLHEIVAKTANFVVMSVLLALVYVALVLWPGNEASLMASVINTLMATAAMLILYAPVRGLIDRWIVQLFFKERYQLEKSVTKLLRRLPGIFEIDALVDELLGSLISTNRVESASVYLWNDEDRAYRMIAHLGDHSLPELQKVPSRPFAEGLLRERTPMLRDELQNLVQRHQLLPPARREADAREREWKSDALHTLDGMNADITLPFLSGRSVLGWLNLRGETGDVGFTRAEIELLTSLTERAASGIDASRQFERMKDRERLAHLGEMSAGLAHEIRNPLGAIKGAAQVIQQSDDPASQDEFVGIIVEEVDRLNAVVGQFLDYARPILLDRQEISVGPMIRSVIQVVETDGLPGGVRLRMDLPKDLPPIPLDVEKLRQVLLNLVRNAIEAMPDGGQLAVQVRYYQALRRVRPLGGSNRRRRVGTLENPLQGAMELVVADTGQGISPENLTRLFIPFYTTKNGGNGLGLAICERIVREHGGEMEVQSREGAGTRFMIRLPMNPTDPTQKSSLSMRAAGS